MEQRSPEWFEARRGKVTSSRIADVMAKGRGSQPSATRANYMAQLVAERLTGNVEESYTNTAMQWGADTEPQARLAYELGRNVSIAEVGFVDHPTIPMSGASPDGLILDHGLVEIKCPNTATHIATLRGASIDGKYIKQMQWQMACTARAWCDFISYDPRLPLALEMFVCRIERDDDMIREIEAEVLSFHADLDAMLEDLHRLEVIHNLEAAE